MSKFEDFIFRVGFVLIFGTIGLMILFLVAMPFVGFNSNPGYGQKVGQIVRMTNEGIVCKTYEAQLIRGGLNDGSGAFGIKSFEFTVPEHLTDKVQAALDKQIEVVIDYDTNFFYATCNSGSSGNYLTKIKPFKSE